MKKHYLFVLLVSLLLNLGLGVYIVSKTYKNTKPIFQPFDINFDSTFDALVKDGYDLLGEDFLMGKRIGDTLIYYQFTTKCKEKNIIKPEVINEKTHNFIVSVPTKCKPVGPSWRNCEIKLKGFDSLEVVSLLEKYSDVYIISDWNMDSPRFFIKYHKTNLIYCCSIYNYTEDDWVLGISCDLPNR